MAELWLPLIVAGALLVEAALGFGSSVIVATLGAQLGPLDRVMPAFITVNLALSAWVTATSWRDIDRALLLRLVLPLASVGLALGFALGGAADRPAARAAFGAGVAVLSALELVRAVAPSRDARPLSPVPSAAMILLGGVVHGVFSAGGPLVVYVVARRVGEKRVFRATLSALWLLLNAALVARWVADGTWSSRTARQALLLVPSLLLGSALGAALYRALPQRAFRVAAASVMGAAGLSLLLRTLLR